MTRMTAYRRSATVAVAALLVSGVAAPTALAAAPEQPSATTAAPSPDDAPLVGAGLSLDLGAGLGLHAHGIAAAGINGAADVDGRVSLRVDKGSKITYVDKRVTGGQVRLVGGIQLSKGNKRVNITNVSVNLRSGAVTADVGARAHVVIGSVARPTVHATVRDGSSTARVHLGDGIRLNAGVLADVDAGLGTTVFADVGTGVDVDARLGADVAVAKHGHVHHGLLAALGLNLGLGLGLGVGVGL
ncbi:MULTISPECIES: hypothetical protein [unclassified Streptomyces]|uniref:hypothetical protein n=1 Tax=unclassified Streptomyces TaxID=2593676 RepID=UPI00278BAE45|nr:MULTISPECIES: hypothetical protein [unclassified Streptomyces]